MKRRFYPRDGQKISAPVCRALCGAIASALLVCSCASPPEAEPDGEVNLVGVVPDWSDLAALEAEILAMIGTASCKEVSECAAIALGDKPCGGPRKYLVYSRSTLDVKELEEAVADYFALNSEINDRYRLISDCQYVTAPEVDCVDGACQAVNELPL